MLKSKQIQSVATLAKLNVDENIEDITRDLNNFLSLIDTLALVDTTDISPMAHPFDFTQRLRTDEVSEINNRENFQKNAPLTKQKYYLVPRVI